MNTTHDATASRQSLAPSRPRGTRRNAIWLLDAALAIQLAVWIVAVLTANNLRSAFGQAHPGLHATLVIGGAIWLSQFAIVVIVAHLRSRRHSR
jgi:hypothetical protein